MNDLLRFYRHALRVGNRPLAELLARVTRGDPQLRGRADQALQAMPRGHARWSAGAERAVRRVIDRIGAALL